MGGRCEGGGAHMGGRCEGGGLIWVVGGRCEGGGGAGLWGLCQHHMVHL